ncbi:MAG: HEPN domain-containing protein [Nanoarchaeota archaeon]
MNLKEGIEKRYLVPEKSSPDLVEKELRESRYDLSRAKKACQEGDYKWAIIKSYYSMFHAGKAVCFQLGYREKKHFAIAIILEELYSEGKLESQFVAYFNAAIDSREGADYHYSYSQETAEHNLKMAEAFNNRMGKLLEEI